MQLGMIGLGRMGANMTRRLLHGGHAMVAYDLSADRVRELAAEGATGATSVDDLIGKLQAPRAVWIMVPAGTPTDEMVSQLGRRLSPGDVIIDGGNSHFKDDVRRAADLKARGIHYVDAGTSGGVWGLERGYSLMIGGDREVVDRLEPIFATLAPGDDGATPATGPGRVRMSANRGYLYCGKAGAGHFVKMVHNGIEYGVMQAYAEGFDIMKGAASPHVDERYRFDLNLADIAEVWRHGSVVQSWLLDLTAMALAEDPALSQFTGSVQDSGEGRWTIETAIEEAVPADVLATALFARFRSRVDHTFGEKVLSAMRHKFGGHVERPAGG
ncbi:MAG TPA: decarboxylating 6-phosphogluconate dehydrogenase [Vicinamibacterales bacterium]|nr:decarboxylating 6-phosphogluconate dehydrogenase [Vicinamibacterales bacterium]